MALVKTDLETRNWEVLVHPPNLPDVASSDDDLIRSMVHGLFEQHFISYEPTKKIGLIRGWPEKMKRSSYAVSVCCQKDRKK